jgi:mono/diheme cytochrome c family protein
MRHSPLLLPAALIVIACKVTAPHGFRAPVKLGGQLIPAAVLTEGERSYWQYCRACHGEQGDGKGPSAPALRPPPRDFRLGLFKFAAVSAGTLPRDEDLVRIVRTGLHGTAMLAWDGIPEKNLLEIIQFVKTFSPRWAEEEPGEAIVPTPDPWSGKTDEGLARGKLVYHGLAQCLSCHPSYASKKYIYEASKALTGNGTTDFRDDMYGSVLKESDYAVKLLPPDFLRSDLRSVRADHQLEDVYRVIAAGVGGTAMPTWRGSLPEEDLWALTHFVSSLVGLRGTPAAADLVRRAEQEDKHWQAPSQAGDQQP